MTINTEYGVFLWARCGNGHKTAKDARVEKFIEEGKKENFTPKIIDIDVTDKILNAITLPFIGKVGDYGVQFWNNAQQTGDLAAQRKFASSSWLGETCAYSLFYGHVYKLLNNLDQEPRCVEATQAFCISAIVHAVKNINKKRGWNMHVALHLTDLPSKKAVHFFPSIKHVGDDQELSKSLVLHATKPLLTKKDVSEEDFWKQHCGKHIVVQTPKEFPVRSEFCQTNEIKRSLQQETLIVKMQPSQEIELHNNTYVSLLMLGSQPTNHSVIQWLDTFLDMTTQSSKNHVFFLYCGAPPSQEKPNMLLELVEEKITETQLSDRIKIIPFTHQPAATIALLLARSDCTITRSGGATCMELLQLYKNQAKRENALTLIHAEEVAQNLAEKELRKKGIVLWESGNAKYLQKEMEARVVTPESAKMVFSELLKNKLL